MFEPNPATQLARPQAAVANMQRRRLLVALSLLLAALVVVVIKDRQFWFGSDEALASDDSENVAQADSTPAPAKTDPTPVAHVVDAKAHVAGKAPSDPAATEPSDDKAVSNDSPVVVNNRAVLPPLLIEVVAGEKHSTIRAGSNVAALKISSNSNRAAVVTASMVNVPTNAAQHERLSSDNAQDEQTVDSTSYPLLGQHMSVWGSVVLQAVVSADGIIESLRVISGPAILTSAAEQAVRQWRFKPYLQNGRPVETKARLTVNFSIKVR